MRKSIYSDYIEPDDSADPTQALIDTPEPAERLHSEPLFPMGGTPFTPTSKCAHWCKKCSGSGVIGIDPETDEPVECPACFDPETKKGTGQSWPDAPFYCPICHRSGMDGRKATPHEVEPVAEAA